MSLELYREYPDANESAAVNELIELTIRTMKTKYLTGVQPRDTHVKGLAVVKGTFSIAPDLPADLRVGLFATPKSYECLCRFSNTDPNPKPDLKNDMRAVSIKLFNVAGEMCWHDDPDARTLDFLLMTAKTFMTSDIRSFIKMQEVLLHAFLEPVKGNLSVIAFFAEHPAIARRVAQGEITCANLLEMPYFSETAYRFGEKAVQYKLVPHKPATSDLPGPGAAFNYLNQRLRDDLATGDAVFDFMVQFQVDPMTMPIEDTGVAWSEELSPPRKVATLRLQQQSVDEPALNTTGEHLSFNPWRTLREHQPLGWANRARLKVYEAVSQFRHEKNAVPVREPRG
jgi:hypothetical protein